MHRHICEPGLIERGSGIQHGGHGLYLATETRGIKRCHCSPGLLITGLKAYIVQSLIGPITLVTVFVWFVTNLYVQGVIITILYFLQSYEICFELQTCSLFTAFSLILLFYFVYYFVGNILNKSPSIILLICISLPQMIKDLQLSISLQICYIKFPIISERDI